MKSGLLSRSCCTSPAAMCFWAAMFVLIYGAALILRTSWPALQPFGDTAILVALGGACLATFGRNRTLHCGLTGPLFVLGAVATALIEGGIWQVDTAIIWVWCSWASASPSSSNGARSARIQVNARRENATVTPNALGPSTIAELG
jgi:hypothetical protein